MEADRKIDENSGDPGGGARRRVVSQEDPIVECEITMQGARRSQMFVVAGHYYINEDTYYNWLIMPAAHVVITDLATRAFTFRAPHMAQLNHFKKKIPRHYSCPYHQWEYLRSSRNQKGYRHQFQGGSCRENVEIFS